MYRVIGSFVHIRSTFVVHSAPTVHTGTAIKIYTIPQEVIIMSTEL